MTAINIFPSPKRVHLFTDGICYADDGTIVGLVTKVLTAPHLPAAIAVRGAAPLLYSLGGHLAVRWQSFDDLIAGIEAELRTMESALSKAHVCGMADLVIAGWSQARNEAEAYFIRTYEFEVPEGCVAAGPMPPAFTLAKIDTVTPTPHPNGWQGGDIKASDHEGIKLMQQQRCSDYGTISRGGMQIGGFVQVTTITRDGIQQRIIHRWPEDQPGSKVGEQAYWTGGLGMYALQAVDVGLRKAGIIPDPPKPEDTLADIPIVRAFAVRYPSAGAQSIQDFYDHASRAKKYHDTWLAQLKEGNVEAEQKIREAGGLVMFARLDALTRVMGEHSKLVRDIHKAPYSVVPKAEKRQLIDQVYHVMIQTAQQGMEMVRVIERVEKPPAELNRIRGMTAGGSTAPVGRQEAVDEARRQYQSGQTVLPTTIRPIAPAPSLPAPKAGGDPSTSKIRGMINEKLGVAPPASAPTTPAPQASGNRLPAPDPSPRPKHKPERAIDANRRRRREQQLRQKAGD